MSILVTGGAGYIGSVTVELLRRAGRRVVVVDNLSTGHRKALFADVPFVHADLSETAKIAEVLRAHGCEAVIHFAASSLVGESVADPQIYMTNNVGGTLSLLRAMRLAGVGRIVFSSTAAVYGMPDSSPITEDQPTRPINPYGLTKLFLEQALASYSAAYGMRSVCLRYFNAAGATAERGEEHVCETHLIPLVLQTALGKRPQVKVFGTDYDTPDGTCVRDYIHVEDLAAAHLAALDYLAGGGETISCNLGNGSGYSVQEVLEVCRQVTGHPIPAEHAPRRPGDPARLVASSELSRRVLGWTPAKPDLATIVADAWAWHRRHPEGY